MPPRASLSLMRISPTSAATGRRVKSLRSMAIHAASCPTASITSHAGSGRSSARRRKRPRARSASIAVISSMNRKPMRE
jgi:hypothetical protein